MPLNLPPLKTPFQYPHPCPPATSPHRRLAPSSSYRPSGLEADHRDADDVFEACEAPDGGEGHDEDEDEDEVEEGVGMWEGGKDGGGMGQDVYDYQTNEVYLYGSIRTWNENTETRF